MKTINKIIIVSLFIICNFLINKIFAFATSPSCNPPYKTIEQAVICSGGTYGVIDTSDSSSTSNFVDTIFDNGLTATDGNGSCTSMNIRPSIKFSCKLSINKDAYYYYNGQKGEVVNVTVSADNFIPEMDISDANGGMEFYDNKQKQKFITITKVLPYTGKYTFEVKTRYYTETKEDEPFKIILTSNKSNIQPDIRKDNLIEDQKYSIYELNQNQSKTKRKFLVDGYITNIYKEPACPPEAYSCPLSQSPNITISDKCTIIDGSCQNTGNNIVLYLEYNKKFDFEILKQYEFEVYVENTSNTNIPNNYYTLHSIKKIKNISLATTTKITVTSTVNFTEPIKKSIFSKLMNWIKIYFIQNTSN